MKVLFVGPSLGSDLAAARAISPCIDFRPPAAAGDILKAVRDGATAIGLVDGYFGDLPSVWHKEILYALEHDVAVAGDLFFGDLPHKLQRGDPAVRAAPVVGDLPFV